MGWTDCLGPPEVTMTSWRGSEGSPDSEDSTDPKEASSIKQPGLLDLMDSEDCSGYLDWLVLNWTELPG